MMHHARPGNVRAMLFGAALVAALVLTGASAVSAEIAGDAAAASAGNPARGAQLFLQCRACHTVDANGRDGVGPNLNGVVGARAAQRPGYLYSPALKASGLTWTQQNLDAFLTRPSTRVPGTRMGFGGVSSAQNRRDLIAYLASLNSKQTRRDGRP